MLDFIVDFFKELFNFIPKIIYLLVASLLSLVDFAQLLFRKLAGLDVYYVDGVATTGDILTNFIGGILGININENTSFGLTDYSLLSTVFWSFVIFGIIILFVSTIVAIIKSHYSYDEKSAKGPLPILATAGKSILNMVAVPVMVILGLYLSQAILSALDSITSVGSDDVVDLYGTENVNTYLRQGITDSQGNQTYIYYDMFGFTGGILYGVNISTAIDSTGSLSLVAARSQTFSGSMFKTAAYNANRVRSGEYTITTAFLGNTGSNMTLFSAHGNDSAVLANMVDEAFANFLHVNEIYWLNWYSADSTHQTIIQAERYVTNFTTWAMSSFSKFNVGLVWYYYDLWSYNFIVAFGLIIICITIFLNIILGLMTRLFMALVLFLILPPLAGLTPLDGGTAFANWRKQFISQVLMAYSAVVGMNLVLLILPYVNEIEFFNIGIVDYLVQAIFIIVGLATIKAVIATLSAIIGAADANETGGKVAGEVKADVMRGAAMTLGAAKLATKPASIAFNKTFGKIPNAIRKGKAKKQAREEMGLGEKEKIKDLDPDQQAEYRRRVQENYQERLARSQQRRQDRRNSVQAFLSGGRGGLRTERQRRELERQRENQERQVNQLESQHRQAQTANLINSLDRRASNDKIESLFRAHGYNDQEISQLLQAADSSRSGGWLNLNNMSDAYGNFNSDYSSFLGTNGGLAGAAGMHGALQGMLNTAQSDLRTTMGNLQNNAQLAAHYRRHPGVIGGLFRGAGITARTTAGLAGQAYSGVFDRNTMDAFEDAMRRSGVSPPRRDYTRETAEGVARLRGEINELSEQIRNQNRNN